MKVCKICGKKWYNGIIFCPIDGAVLEDPNPADVLSPLIGQVLNHTYKIEEKIGEGSASTIYKAKHVGNGDIVVIRVFVFTHIENPDSLMRFIDEAQVARQLCHPNAVAVYDFNITDDGLLFMVTEYVNGVTVEKYLQEHAPLHPQRALEILRPAAAVLDVAHNLGIIHRDLKPVNLMLCQDSLGREQVKVLDFGIAQSLSVEKIESVDGGFTTLQKQVFGTPVYMSPEQALGEPVGASTDIYMLGIILYQMLTGTVPFSGQKPYQIMTAHINDKPEPPSKRNPCLPVKFDDIIYRAMAKKAEDRYQTATALADDLASVVSASVIYGAQAVPKVKKDQLPEKGLGIVNKWISNLPRELVGLEKDEIQVTPSVTIDVAPHKVYLIGFEDAIKGNIFSNLKLLGWRYIIAIEDRFLGAVELSIDKDGNNLQVSNYNKGTYVNNSIKAIKLAERSISKTHNYELGLLKAPSLSVVALWVHFPFNEVNRDTVIVLPPTDRRLEPLSLYPAQGFAQVLKEIAIEKISSSPK